MKYAATRTAPKSLDDGIKPPTKKRKRGQDDPTAAAAKDTPSMPTIMPGERLADFSARVNQALPLSGLNRKGVKVPGIKERRTKIERKITRMQDLWREEEARRKEREEEARDLEEEAEAERWADGAATTPLAQLENEVAAATGGQSKRARRGGKADDDDDPWAVLKETRERPKGLHDVVQAPPNFKKVPRELFKVKNGARVDVANVPKSAGSLRRREELGDARKSIIESYRALMDKKSAA